MSKRVPWSRAQECYPVAEDVVAKYNGRRLRLVVEFADASFYIGEYQRRALDDDNPTWFHRGHTLYKVPDDQAKVLEEIWKELTEDDA